jgi:protein-tyrosine phosphatase
VSGWLSGRSRDGGVDEIPLMGPGRLWLCGKHAVAPDPEAVLRRIGATAVVCLNEAAELQDRYPDYVEWLRVNVPLRAVWFAIPDLHAPDPAAARRLLDDLSGRLAGGAGLLMHCGAGIGRAGTIAAALLMAGGASLSDALTVVADSRPMAGPEAGAQTALLRALAASG